MEYEFTLIIDGDVDSDEVVDKLYDAGCDDATFGVLNGVQIGDFTREATSIFDAIRSAVTQVESVPGLRVRRIEPDDLLTIPEIAERLGRSAESVRLLANGERGGGAFPAPVSHLRTRHRLWRWSDVAAWAEAAKPDEPELADARVIAAFNAALEFRYLMPELEEAVIKAVNETVFAA